MAKASKVQVVLAKLVEDFEVIPGKFEGRYSERAATREIKRPVAIMWARRGSEKDLERANVWAPTEGYRVFTYPTAERDPLGRAKRELLD